MDDLWKINQPHNPPSPSNGGALHPWCCYLWSPQWKSSFARDNVSGRWNNCYLSETESNHVKNINWTTVSETGPHGDVLHFHWRGDSKQHQGSPLAEQAQLLHWRTIIFDEKIFAGSSWWECFVAKHDKFCKHFVSETNVAFSPGVRSFATCLLPRLDENVQQEIFQSCNYLKVYKVPLAFYCLPPYSGQNGMNSIDVGNLNPCCHLAIKFLFNILPGPYLI